MSFLRHWPYLVIAVLTLALIVLYSAYQGQKMTAESRHSIIMEQNAQIEYRKTKEGQIIADKVAAEARAADLEDAYPRLAKVLTEQMDIKLKNLRTSIQAEFEALNSGTSTVIRDTIYREGKSVGIQKSVKIDDGYLRMIGILIPSNSTELEKMDWNYSYQDSVTIALHVKKKWLFGKETLYSSIMLKNPNAKVVNSTTVQIKGARDKRFNISVGVSYDPFRNQFGPSISAGYALFKF